ncbi:MAG: transporter, family [Acidobacteriota bacterium]|nr:transporter, family [Acidobacteriota bacterium]
MSKEKNLTAASNTHAGEERTVPINDRREIFGWIMYDWANSAFYTTVVSALLGPYLTLLAQRQVGENGKVFDLGLGSWSVVTAKSFFTQCVALAVASQVFLLPVLGAIADYTNLKKRLMAVFCYAGAAATCMLFFVTGSLYIMGGLLFIIANLCFGAAIVFYNSFLPEIVTEDMRDKVSSRGFAWGYMGGGLLLLLNFVLVAQAPRLFAPFGLAEGEAKAMAVRLSLLSAGVWWGGFATVTFARLRLRAPARQLPPGKNFLKVGVGELISTFRQLARLPHTLRYLVGYLFYNDGIQTVINASSVFLAQELFISRGLPDNPAFLLGIFLLVQFVAFFGSLLFERIARLVGTKRAILISLVIWSGIVIYAYGFFQTTTQAWVLGGLIGLVIGGSQALSRSLFSRMIPRGHEASFFGIYEISERGTSWLGPQVFSIVVATTNSYRNAILSLIVFFIVGMVILLFTDTDRAVRESGNTLPEEVKQGEGMN